MRSAMGRNKLPESRILISSRVSPQLKKALDTVAAADRRNISQAVELLLEESPRIQVELRKNGRSRRAQTEK